MSDSVTLAGPMVPFSLCRGCACLLDVEDQACSRCGWKRSAADAPRRNGTYVLMGRSEPAVVLVRG